MHKTVFVENMENLFQNIFKIILTIVTVSSNNIAMVTI